MSLSRGLDICHSTDKLRHASSRENLLEFSIDPSLGGCRIPFIPIKTSGMDPGLTREPSSVVYARRTAVPDTTPHPHAWISTRITSGDEYTSNSFLTLDRSDRLNIRYRYNLGAGLISDHKHARLLPKWSLSGSFKMITRPYVGVIHFSQTCYTLSCVLCGSYSRPER